MIKNTFIRLITEYLEKISIIHEMNRRQQGNCNNILSRNRSFQEIKHSKAKIENQGIILMIASALRFYALVAQHFMVAVH